MIYLRIVFEVVSTMTGNLGLSDRRSLLRAFAVLSALLVVTVAWYVGWPSRESVSSAGVEPAKTVTQSAPFTPVSTVVSGEAAQISAAAPVASPGEASPGGSTRTQTIRSIQNALRQAGCYDGTPNGYWSSKTRDGMRRLLVVLNAPLPVDQPDPALLALLASNPAARCDGSVGSPASQSNTPQVNATVAPPVRRPIHEAAAAARAAPSEPVAAEANASDKSALLAGTTAGAAVAAAAVAARQSQTKPDDDTSSDDDREPRRASSNRTSSTRDEPSRPARRTSRRKTATAFDNVSRTMNRNFRSLSRSLSSLFR